MSAAWRGFQSILCPVDFSDHSRLALRYAAALAARNRAALIVLHVDDPLLVSAAAVMLNDRVLVARSLKGLREFVRSTTIAAGAVTRVRVGRAASEILKASRRADVIVMGTHGLTGVGRLLIGSTTVSVLRGTGVPVLAVPAARARHRVPAWPDGPIVAACDLGVRGRGDVERAALLAEWFDSPLVPVHAAHGRSGSAVAHDLAAIAKARRAGLIITTLRDRIGWFGTRRGSISYHVLTHAIVPVLACPVSWRPRVDGRR